MLKKCNKCNKDTKHLIVGGIEGCLECIEKAKKEPIKFKEEKTEDLL